MIVVPTAKPKTRTTAHIDSADYISFMHSFAVYPERIVILSNRRLRSIARRLESDILMTIDNEFTTQQLAAYILLNLPLACLVATMTFSYGPAGLASALLILLPANLLLKAWFKTRKYSLRKLLPLDPSQLHGLHDFLKNICYELYHAGPPPAGEGLQKLLPTAPQKESVLIRIFKRYLGELEGDYDNASPASMEALGRLPMKISVRSVAIRQVALSLLTNLLEEDAL